MATGGVNGGYSRTAASKVVMRSGRHCVQFSGLRGKYMMFGVVRPGWDVLRGMGAESVHGHCFFDTYAGRRLPGRRAWEGRHPAMDQGDCIGMLLDLDQGSTTVWKNDVKLGVMQSEGLRGPLCWAVLLFSRSSARTESAGARVAIRGRALTVIGVSPLYVRPTGGAKGSALRLKNCLAAMPGSAADCVFSQGDVRTPCTFKHIEMHSLWAFM